MAIKKFRIAIAYIISVALTLSTTPVGAWADYAFSAEIGSVFTENGIAYTVTSPTEVSVGAQSASGSAFASAESDVIVPAQAGGYTVTGINSYAFSDGGKQTAKLCSLSLPATVQSIGAYAFAGCKSLTSINFANKGSLESIEKYAFSGCNSLKSLTIPSTVTNVGMYAFAMCPDIESVTFQNVEATKPTISFGEGAFYSSSTGAPKLKEVLLPARLYAVSNSMFENQKSLTNVRFASQSINSIGANAFSKCTSLSYLEIPELTSATSKLGSSAFSCVNSLKTIIFTGPEAIGSVDTGGYGGTVGTTLSDNTFTSSEAPSAGTTGTRYTNPKIETVVYYSTHTHDIYENAAHYYTMTYYPSSKDADSGANMLGFARVRSDVLTSEMTSDLPEKDDKGALIYEGSIPKADDGKTWNYLGMSPGETATDSTLAFQVSPTDISYGQLLISKNEFSYDASPISLKCKLLTPEAKELVEGVDYDISIKDEQGITIPANDVTEIGTYTVTATAKGDYIGSISTTFSIKPASCTWTRLSGNAANATLNHVAESAFQNNAPETAILIGRSSLSSGAAVAGLAGARNALILATDDDALSIEARYNLNKYQPESVILIGIKDIPSVTTAIKNTMESEVTVSAPFDADSPAGTSYNFYSKTLSKGYWDDTDTAIIANSNDAASIVAIGPYAYANSMPIFLTDNGKSVYQKSADVIASSFSHIIFVGSESSIGDSVVKQLTKAGFSGSIERWGDTNDARSQSIDIAKKAVQNNCLSYDGISLASIDDIESAITSISTCGTNKAVLLFTNDATTDNEVVEQIIKPNRYEIHTGYLLSVRQNLSEAFAEYLMHLWVSDSDDASLLNASLSIVHSQFVYTGQAFTPEIALKSSSGKTLTAGTDYTLACYSNATDRKVSASKITDAGTYTIVATGTGVYTDTCSAQFEIAALSITNAVLRTTSFTFTGKAQKPAARVTCKGTELKAGDDYAISYRDNTKTGIAVATIVGKGNYTGNFTRSFKIVPPKIKAFKLKTIGKNALKASWSTTEVKKAGITGYAIKYSIGGNNKTVYVRGAAKSNVKLSKLASGKKVKARIAAFKSVGDKKLFGTWNASVAVKVK